MKAMEYRSVVYNAARDGKLNRLKIFLDHKSKEEIGKLVHAKTNGATPLIMACRNGHIDVVKYIVEQCTAEIEQVGSVTFDGETIEGAPPLWCAAAAGHLEIVQYLISKGAGVNKTTFTNSTPLRAACFDGHYEIVKHLVNNEADIEIANRHGHTCLMISCYKGHKEIAQYLLELNADVNRKSVKGTELLSNILMLMSICKMCMCTFTMYMYFWEILFGVEQKNFLLEVYMRIKNAHQLLHNQHEM